MAIDRRRKPIPIDYEWLRQKYCDELLTSSEIARLCGRAERTICYHLTKAKIKARHLKAPNAIYKNRSWLLENYAVKGRSVADLAEECGVSKSVICYNMDKARIPRRKQVPHGRNERANKKRYWMKIRHKIAIRLANRFREAIWRSLKRNKNGYRWEQLVGYTAEDLRAHIESQWEPWMNWNNWGRYSQDKRTWQIDHIIPISSFNITSPECDDFKKCWALDNLRPIESRENIIKQNKLCVS